MRNKIPTVRNKLLTEFVETNNPSTTLNVPNTSPKPTSDVGIGICSITGKTCIHKNEYINCNTNYGDISNGNKVNVCKVIVENHKHIKDEDDNHRRKKK